MGAVTVDLIKDYNFDAGKTVGGIYDLTYLSQMPDAGLAQDFVVRGSQTLTIDRTR